MSYIPKHVIILGGGPGGLATGHEVSTKGGKVTVLEKNDYVGGLCRTIEDKGYKFDLGGHRWFSKNEDLNIRRKNIRRIVAAASIILALSIVNTNRNNFNNQSGINPFSGFGTTDNQTYTVSKDVKTNSDKDCIVSAKDVKEKILIKNDEKADKTPVLSKVKNTSVKKYYIIAGSFSDDYNAKKFTKELIESGYNAIMLKPDRGRFRVAFATYINKADALKELKKIRATKASSAWLLAKKN